MIDSAWVTLDLWRSLAAAQAALARQLGADDETCPVVGSDALDILIPLVEAPDRRMRMRGLAESAHLTRSGLTRRIDRLEADGLVARDLCPGDRRGAYALITERGLEELERALPYHAASLDRHVAPRLSGAEADDLIELLERLSRPPTGAMR